MRVDELFEGGCACRPVRYPLRGAPLFVRRCHCTWCRRVRALGR